MSAPYDPEFRRIAAALALERRLRLEEGGYAALLGPSYETPRIAPSNLASEAAGD